MRVLPNLSHALMAALMLLAAQAALAAEITGRVVGITDGDTLTVLNEARQQVRVRLAEIDTPEARQPYGSRARQALSDLAFGKTVRVVVQDTDRYGRTVGRIHAGATDVNAEMVRQGAAWVYRQYSRDPFLLRLEAEARAARRGLWALPEAERAAPWEWRAAGRNGQRPAAATPAAPQATRLLTAGGFTCGAKRYCREMTTCAEARFYLSQCGLSRLDGDRDGVPCESICR
jgi:endonuclease YncB( thermonuclease family)